MTRRRFDRILGSKLAGYSVGAFVISLSAPTKSERHLSFREASGSSSLRFRIFFKTSDSSILEKIHSGRFIEILAY